MQTGRLTVKTDRDFKIPSRTPWPGRNSINPKTTQVNKYECASRCSPDAGPNTCRHSCMDLRHTRRKCSDTFYPEIPPSSCTGSCSLRQYRHLMKVRTGMSNDCRSMATNDQPERLHMNGWDGEGRDTGMWSWTNCNDSNGYSSIMCWTVKTAHLIEWPENW